MRSVRSALVGLGTLIVLVTFVGFATFSADVPGRSRLETPPNEPPQPLVLAADAGAATGRVTAFVFANQLQAPTPPTSADVSRCGSHRSRGFPGDRRAHACLGGRAGENPSLPQYDRRGVFNHHDHGHLYHHDHHHTTDATTTTTSRLPRPPRHRPPLRRNRRLRPPPQNPRPPPRNPPLPPRNRRPPLPPPPHHRAARSAKAKCEHWPRCISRTRNWTRRYWWRAASLVTTRPPTTRADRTPGSISIRSPTGTPGRRQQVGPEPASMTRLRTRRLPPGWWHATAGATGLIAQPGRTANWADSLNRPGDRAVRFPLCRSW